MVIHGNLWIFNQVSLEREARKIAELMTRVANKLAAGGGGVDRTAVRGDILVAKNMINGMADRLEL